MDRREFLAAGAGGGAILLAGVGAALGSTSLDAGPAYGPVSTPPSTGSKTLNNGLQASLYEDGAIAFLGASLVSDSSSTAAVVGRLKNISDTTLDQVRVKVQFLANGDDILLQGWVARESLADGQAWQFVARYSGDDPDRIAGANIAAIGAY
ncbi:FxLYD domain-containing protein [Halococcus sp. AFM35]|uniref:FxLYD domain-containing protein n=1 Tax=Halococcus sp. AFM35 TaxID=3421653 RepID=UPI003EBC08E9